MSEAPLNHHMGQRRPSAMSLSTREAPAPEPETDPHAEPEPEQPGPAPSASRTWHRSRLAWFAQPLAALLVLGLLVGYLALLTGHTPRGFGNIGGGYSTQTGIPASGSVVVAGGAGAITAVRSSDGQMVWRFTFTSASHASASNGAVTGLIVGNGVVYADTDGGDIFALRARDGALLWRKAFGPTPRIHFTGDVLVVYDWNGIHALNANTGSTLWSDNDQNPYPLAASAGTVYVARSTPASDWSVNALRASDGKRLWTYSTGPDLPHVVLPLGDVVYLYISGVIGPTESQPATVAAVRQRDGTQRWRQPSPYDDGAMLGLGAMAADPQFVYVQAYAQHYLCAYAIRSGVRAWCTPDLGLAQPVTVLKSGVYIGREVEGANGTYYYQQGVVQPQTGAVHWLWRSPALPGGFADSVTSSDGTVYLTTSSGIYAYRISDGHSLWHALPDEKSGAVAYGAV